MNHNLSVYRLRMLMGQWHVITNIDWIPFPSFHSAQRYANGLEMQGYIDGDK